MKFRIANRLQRRHGFVRAAPALRAAVVCAAVIGMSSCSTADRRTADEKAADQSLVDRVQVALQADPDIYADHIDISSRRGVVWLTGWVTSAQESAAAERDTQAVPGVKRVVNEMDLMDWATHY
jgi:osmotically-inducible protein OsmY